MRDGKTYLSTGLIYNTRNTKALLYSLNILLYILEYDMSYSAFERKCWPTKVKDSEASHSFKGAIPIQY